MDIELSEKGANTNERFTFSLWDSSDKDCVFAGLKIFFACSQVFKFFAEWIPAIKNNAEITKI